MQRRFFGNLLLGCLIAIVCLLSACGGSNDSTSSAPLTDTNFVEDDNSQSEIEFNPDTGYDWLPINPDPILRNFGFEDTRLGSLSYRNQTHILARKEVTGATLRNEGRSSFQRITTVTANNPDFGEVTVGYRDDGLPIFANSSVADIQYTWESSPDPELSSITVTYPDATEQTIELAPFRQSAKQTSSSQTRFATPPGAGSETVDIICTGVTIAGGAGTVLSAAVTAGAVTGGAAVPVIITGIGLAGIFCAGFYFETKIVFNLGKIFGDPHLMTLDGYKYSFQGVGEFVLARSTQGIFEVQARFQQTVSGASVSTNRATGIRIKDNEFAVHERGSELYINGELYQGNERLIILSDGTSVAISTNVLNSKTYLFSTEDELNISVSRLGRQVEIDSPYFNQMEGLLGNLDNDPKNDLMTSDGQPLSDTVTLYGEFADSWRISDESSYFVYNDGEDTEFFTNTRLPDLFDLDNFTSVEIEAAELQCIAAGITMPTFIETCVHDLLASGSEEFISDSTNQPEPMLDAGLSVVRGFTASINAMESATIGDGIFVSWEGPGGPQDIVTIVPANSANTFVGPFFRALSEVEPAQGGGTLTVTQGSGPHEIRYIQGGGAVLSRFAILIVSEDADQDTTVPLSVPSEFDPDPALAVAAFQNNLQAIEQLLTEGEDPNIARESDGWTPLMFATQGGYLDIAQALVGRGANVNTGTLDDWTPLMIASQNGHTEVVTYLLSVGASTNISRDDNWTALHSAVTNSRVQTVEILLEAGTPLNASRRGFTPLTFACQEGETESAELLLQFGANPLGDPANGPSPAFMATQNNHLDCLQLVLESGADPNNGGENDPPIISAGSQGRVEAYSILTGFGADVDVQDSRLGFTALMWAANNNDTPSVTELLSLGADRSLESDRGETALEIAERLNFQDIIELLN